MKDRIPWEGPHSGAGEQHEEERAAEGKCYELTATPIRHPPEPLSSGEAVEKSRMKE